MAKYTVPTDDDKRILLENHIDPEAVSVSYRDKDCIRLLNHKTRDTIVVHRGDRQW